jgi:hypothetical protein
MISLDQLKKIDPKLSKYSDEELTKIRALLYSLGQLAIESFLESKKSSTISAKGIAIKKDFMPHLQQ